MNNKCKKYSVTIQWSKEDQLYIATLPEFPICHTHGKTYEEAVQQAEEVLQLLIEANEEWNRPMPVPRVITPPPADIDDEQMRGAA